MCHLTTEFSSAKHMRAGVWPPPHPAQALPGVPPETLPPFPPPSPRSHQSTFCAVHLSTRSVFTPLGLPLPTHRHPFLFKATYYPTAWRAGLVFIHSSTSGDCGSHGCGCHAPRCLHFGTLSPEPSCDLHSRQMLMKPLKDSGGRLGQGQRRRRVLNVLWVPRGKAGA